MNGDHGLTVGDLAGALDRRFPADWAEPWDRVASSSETRRSRPHRSWSRWTPLLSLWSGRTRSGLKRWSHIIRRTSSSRIASSPVRSRGGVGGRTAARRRGHFLHTNLDRSPEGATALPALLGLRVDAPLETVVEEVALVLTYAPAPGESGDHRRHVRCGRGSLGRLRAVCVRCRWRWAVHAARERPSGRRGSRCRSRREANRDGLPRGTRVRRPRGRARCAPVRRAGHRSRRCRAQPGHRTAGQALRLDHRRDALASSLATCRAPSAAPVRVWGGVSQSVERVAVANGSAGSLVPAAVGSADVLIAGEVRYHDALTRVSAGLAIVEAGHDVTEWPLVTVLASAIREIATGALTVTAETQDRSWRVVESADDPG